MNQSDQHAQLSAEHCAWLTTDTAATTAKATFVNSLDGLSAADRQACIDWLEIPDPAPGDDQDQAQTATVAWLLNARTVLASDQLSITAKLSKLAENPPSGVTLSILKAGLANYQQLPLALQVSIPATLIAAPFLGGAGVGLAAFGGAIGLPALLVFFLGVSGITSVIESLLQTNDETATFQHAVLALLATDAALFRLKQATRAAVAQDIAAPLKQPMPTAQDALHAKLLTLSPLEFERHVMAFFSAAGMTAWVTPAGSDAGIDGVAKDGQRLILVQCKRYAPDHAVGRPAIQQFKGVLEENAADLGVFVTTSTFTAQAQDSAAKNDRLILIDAAQLLRWHVGEFSLPTVA